MAELKDTWFRAYLKGNLLMPQNYAAGAVFLAEAVLEFDDLTEFESATEMSSLQFRRLRRVMQAAHWVREIPAGNEEFIEKALEHGSFGMARTIIIDEERLHYIWNRFREQAIVVVKALAQQPDGLRVVKQLTAGFQTRECRNLLKRYRSEYDRRHHGSDEAALVLRNAIFAYVDGRVFPPRKRGFLEELFCPKEYVQLDSPQVTRQG